MAWDALGNLINRHDPCGSHANGNVTSDTSGRNFHYASFDKLRRVSQGTTHTEFHYGAGREKTLKRELAGSTVQSRTHYVGSVEVVWTGASPGAGSGQYRRAIAGVAIATWYQSTGVLQKRYLHTDHLGSITAISNESGQVETWMGFDAWGQRRDADAWHPWQQPPAMYLNAMLAITPRGFTGHEHVDTAGIIHMNGRIYDPRLGRFLQADPFVEDTTTLNRYTYVHNNPLAYTDPSGYLSWKSVKKWVKIAVVVAASVVTYGAASAYFATMLTSQILINAAAGAVAGFVSGGLATGTLEGAFTGALGGAIMGAAAGVNWSSAVTRTLGMATAGGVQSSLSGGKFGHGFAAAGITSAAAPGIDQVPRGGKTIASAVLGGSVSRITGGKFANGAATGAMSYAFGQLANETEEQRLEREGRPLTADEREIFADHFPEETLDSARIIDGRVPWWLRKDMAAITLGNRIHFREGVYVAGTASGAEILAHELVHVQQFSEGMTILRYLLESRRGYSNNRFEIEAYSRDTQIRGSFCQSNPQAEGC